MELLVNMLDSHLNVQYIVGYVVCSTVLQHAHLALCKMTMHGNTLKMEAVRFSGTLVKVLYLEGVNF